MCALVAHVLGCCLIGSMQKGGKPYARPGQPAGQPVRPGLPRKVQHSVGEPQNERNGQQTHTGQQTHGLPACAQQQAEGAAGQSTPAGPALGAVPTCLAFSFACCASSSACVSLPCSLSLALSAASSDCTYGPYPSCSCLTLSSTCGARQAATHTTHARGRCCSKPSHAAPRQGSSPRTRWRFQWPTSAAPASTSCLLCRQAALIMPARPQRPTEPSLPAGRHHCFTASCPYQQHKAARGMALL